MHTRFHFDPRPPKSPGWRVPSPIKGKFKLACGRENNHRLWSTEYVPSVTCKACLLKMTERKS